MVHAIIMAGGRGTRFWPLSRKIRAKQFIRLIDHRSFLEHTLYRLGAFIPVDRRWIVSNIDQRDCVEEQCGDVLSHHILYEPFSRNTAPCIGWAALEVLKEDPDATLVVLPSDHLIPDSNHFCRVLSDAVSLANEKNVLVTIGIPPTEPFIGYGYIESHDKASYMSPVKGFHEKPDLETAISYLSSGNYFWNAGIFIWKARKILDLIKLNMPTLYHQLCDFQLSRNLNIYEEIEGVSIDYGIMEKASEDTWVVRGDFRWSDVGSWRSLDGLLPQDVNQNVSNTRLIALDSSHNIVHSDRKIVTLVDVHDLVIADSNDALLISRKSQDQRLKDLYAQLPEEFL
jgi:mannose-1-phosphate guanylyltransferase